MDLRQLSLFSTVAEFGSFSRAVAVLGVAQPLLSRQVKALETELDNTGGWRRTRAEPRHDGRWRRKK